MSDSISLTGTVSGETKTDYSSSAASEFVTVEVEVGDEVKEGDIIATLDKESIQSQINTLEKSLSNASALRDNQSKLNQRALESAKKDQENQLNQANQAISNANAAYTAAENMVKDLSAQITTLTNQMNQSQDEEEKASISAQIGQLQEQLSAAKEELSAADNARTEAKSNYNSVKAATDEAIFSAQNAIDVEKYSTEDDSSVQTQLDDLRKQLEDCTITSDADGIVTAVNVSAGDMNTPGTAAITVENNKSMIMTASVAETDILKLEEGMKAIVTADALEDNGDGTYTAVRKDIQTGDEVNYYTEVTGGDVKEGDYVILDYSISEGDVFHAESFMGDMEDSVDISIE